MDDALAVCVRHGLGHREHVRERGQALAQRAQGLDEPSQGAAGAR
jgi:hypothetical protein